MSAPAPKLLEGLKEETQRITNELLDNCQKREQEIDNLLQSNSQLINVFSKAEKQMHETVAQNEINMKEKRKRLENLKVTINEKRNQIKKAKTEVGSAKTCSEAGGVADEVDRMKTDLQKTFGSFEEHVSEEEKTHSELREVVNTTNENMAQLQKIMAKNLPPRVTIESLKSRDEDVLDLVRQGQVFASLDIEGRSRLAQLSLDENNQMLLHCLREQIPPHDASILKHPDVMNLFTDSSSKRIFLNFGTDEKSLGRIYISLEPDLKRSQNFWVLCTGEMGPSYLNSNISEVRYKGSDKEEIICGDYDGIGGKALIPGTGGEKRGILRQWLAGSVSGWIGDDNQAAKFSIDMRDYYYNYHDTIFGKVESNYLHILEEAISQYENISEVKITDCGIVIPI